MTTAGVTSRSRRGVLATARIAIFLLIAFAITILLYRLEVAAFPRLAEREDAAIWAALAGLAAAHLLMVRLIDRSLWSRVGLGRSGASPRVLGWAFLVGSLAIAVPSLLLLAARWLRPLALASADAESWLHFAGGAALFLAPSALMEELLIRGYIFAVLRELAGWRPTLLLTSLVFGALHGKNPGASPESVGMVMLAGLFLGGILVATGSLWAAWITHFAWNWVMAALFHTTVSGFAMPFPGYQLVTAGPAWVTGGAWGPEGGAAAAVGMGGGLWCVYRRGRRAQRESAA
ncbi:MAG: CPBP family intramembrane metalloprotease [Gemmatimonadota bacterium]|nr:CPBP family intramembrane metalloprotease [Gemmatimonadota bacterium]